MLIYDERSPHQPKMKIGGPTHADMALLHHLQPHCIHECQILIPEPAQPPSRLLEVHAQSGKKIAVSQSNQWIAAANRIRPVIGCP